MKRVSIHYKLSRQMLNALKAVAQKQRRSVSSLCRHWFLDIDDIETLEPYVVTKGDMICSQIAYLQNEQEMVQLKSNMARLKCEEYGEYARDIIKYNLAKLVGGCHGKSKGV